MYKDHFRLRAMPFSIAPDPSYFYLSNQHRDALTHLRHALGGEAGLLVMSGEVGTGKTAVCRRLLTELPRDVEVALIHNPCMTADELLATLCQMFHVAGASQDGMPADHRLLILDHLQSSKLAAKTSLLIIDEAQNLSSDVLDQLRQLTAAVAAQQLKLCVVLIGQPELNELLAQPQNARINDAIDLRFHLGPLSLEEVDGYVQHRLTVAGCTQRPIPHRLVPLLHRISRGLPRLINLICDRALLGACVLGKQSVTARILREAGAEALGTQASIRRKWLAPAALGGACTLALAGASLAVAMQATGQGLSSFLRPASAAVAAPTAPMAADPLDWPDSVTGPHNEAIAFATLLRRWNVVPGEDPPCSPRGHSGLRCVQGRDRFEDVRRLGVPAVLELRDRRGRPLHVALVQASADQAVLQLGDTVRRVPVPALEAQWTQRYVVLWRPPPEAQGRHDGRVRWIRDHVARLQRSGGAALPMPTTAARQPGSWRAELKAFQAREGLTPTGEDDLRTLVHLASRTDPGTPTLQTPER